ncbi:MAG: ATP-binding protein, partial [Gemmata sp.]
LDELPACAPDVQKAFYSLLLERRIGEYRLPPGTWVVAAGNRAEDKALVRTISSALVNRVLILNVRVDVGEWLSWARDSGVRVDVVRFVEENPEALLRPVPDRAVPFSTPRAWASLARALDLVAARGHLTPALVRALATGRVSDEDARRFASAWVG